MKAEEIQKLSDRELLVRTFGKVEKIEGLVCGTNGGGHEGRIKEIEKNQNNFVTKNLLVLVISISAGIFIPSGVFLTKLLGFW